MIVILHTFITSSEFLLAYVAAGGSFESFLGILIHNYLLRFLYVFVEDVTNGLRHAIQEMLRCVFTLVYNTLHLVSRNIGRYQIVVRNRFVFLILNRFRCFLTPYPLTFLRHTTWWIIHVLFLKFRIFDTGGYSFVECRS